MRANPRDHKRKVRPRQPDRCQRRTFFFSLRIYSDKMLS